MSMNNLSSTFTMPQNIKRKKKKRNGRERNPIDIEIQCVGGTN